MDKSPKDKNAQDADTKDNINAAVEQSAKNDDGSEAENSGVLDTGPSTSAGSRSNAANSKDNSRDLGKGSSDSAVGEKPDSCYCGKDRNLNIVELLCVTCNRWFHESCISYQLNKLVPFITNYVFVCKNCSNTGLESFRKIQATIAQMCVTAIANIQQKSVRDGTSQTLFSKDKEIIPFLEQHWESMTTTPRRVTQSWHTTVQRALAKEVNIIFTFEENSELGAMYGLIIQDLRFIKPNYESFGKSGLLRVNEHGYAQPTATANNATTLTMGKEDEEITSTSKGGRQKRRGAGGEAGATGKKGRPSSDVTGNVKLPPHGYPLEHPFNKDGYRYILAEPDPHAPFRQEFDESSDWAGKPIPGWLYRALAPHSVLLALHDRAPQLKVSEDRLGVTGERGYCMIRATHSVNRGIWYYEVNVDEMPDNSAARIGWGREYSNLQAPLGYDRFGFSWRSRKGTRFSESHGKHYSNGYFEGDVLGFLIELPEEEGVDYLPPTYKDRPLVKFKSHLYYEDKDQMNDVIRNLRPLVGSKIEFFRNGQSQGVAFNDISFGSYYPAISLYKNIQLTVNFGPNFKHSEILEQRNAKGMHERVEELITERCLSDLLYLTENDGRLRLDNL